jgi:hypothetical protein
MRVHTYVLNYVFVLPDDGPYIGPKHAAFFKTLQAVLYLTVIYKYDCNATAYRDESYQKHKYAHFKCSHYTPQKHAQVKV